LNIQIKAVDTKIVINDIDQKGATLMNHFASGVVAGGVIAAIGVSMILSDNKTRRRMKRGHRRAMRKTEDFINSVSDIL